MKYIKSFFISLFFLILMNTNIFGIEVCVNKCLIDVQAVLIDGTCFVPLRGVFEKLGYRVGYDSISETAYISSDDTDIVIKNGQYKFTVNGKIIYPPKAQILINGKFYIPLRSVAESIGAEVIWDKGKVFIDSTQEMPNNETQKAIFEEKSGIKMDFYSNDNLKSISEKSYIFKADEGFYFVTAGKGKVDIDIIDNNYNHISKNIIEYDLPLFGGYYYDGIYHYIVTGKENSNQYSEDAVYKIQQYDKNLNLFNEYKLSPKYSGVSIPFINNYVEFEKCGDVLYITDLCKRFAPKNTNKEQINYMICLNTKNLSIINKSVINEIENNADYLYRGFKAFMIAKENGNVEICGTGINSNPYIYIKQILNKAINISSESKIYSVYNNDNIENAINLYGFTDLGENFIAIGASLPQYDNGKQENIFIVAIPKNNVKSSFSKIIKITDYSENSNIKIKNAKYKKISDSSAFIIWEEEQNEVVTVKSVIIDKNGDILGKINADNYLKLSNCDLYYENGKIMWFCSDEENENTYLYKIDV